jgi:DNA replication and repair protein RecF
MPSFIVKQQGSYFVCEGLIFLYVENVTLKGYRNYTNKSVEFSRGVNIFKGENAQGKTNLLEAVYFLSCGKSFRTQKDVDLINFSMDKAYLKAGIVNAAGKGMVEALLTREGKKSLKLNAQPVKKLTDLFGQILTVVFSPEEMKILKESPSLRRKFVDMEISKVRPAYLHELQVYEKAMANKNALLKSKMKPEQVKKLVSVFNLQMAEAGEQIIKRRIGYLKVLDEKAEALHKQLTGEKEEMGVAYKPCVEGENIKEALYRKFEETFESEMQNGYTVAGPHREDFQFTVNRRDAKAFASQGQQRSALLSVKLATVQIIKETLKEMPVVLLDDVFSELDLTRQTALLAMLKDMQIIITTAAETPVEFSKIQLSEYQVKNGDIAKLR